MKADQTSKFRRTQPHPQLRKIVINYDPTEPFSADEWPLEEDKTSTKPKAKSGSAKGLIHMAPDFDTPLEDFKPCME